jgi:hypothetical protein
MVLREEGYGNTRASQFSRYLLRNIGSFDRDKNVRADAV